MKPIKMSKNKLFFSTEIKYFVIFTIESILLQRITTENFTTEKNIPYHVVFLHFENHKKNIYSSQNLTFWTHDTLVHTSVPNLTP